MQGKQDFFRQISRLLLTTSSPPFPCSCAWCHFCTPIFDCVVLLFSFSDTFRWYVSFLNFPELRCPLNFTFTFLVLFSSQILMAAMASCEKVPKTTNSLFNANLHISKEWEFLHVFRNHLLCVMCAHINQVCGSILVTGNLVEENLKLSMNFYQTPHIISKYANNCNLGHAMWHAVKKCKAGKGEAVA